MGIEQPPQMEGEPMEISPQNMEVLPPVKQGEAFNKETKEAPVSGTENTQPLSIDERMEKIARDAEVRMDTVARDANEAVDRIFEKVTGQKPRPGTINGTIPDGHFGTYTKPSSEVSRENDKGK